MSLDDIVNVNVSLASTGLAKPGFGKILVAANTTTAVATLWGPELVREYSSAAQMLAVTEGFVAADAAYKRVVQAFSQTPKPKTVKVGRLTTNHTQTVELTPTNTTVGFVYSGKVQGVAWRFPVAAATVSSICTGIAAAITAALVAALPVSGCTAIAGATKVTITATAGLTLDLTEMTGPAYMSVADVTADPGTSGTATDLTAIVAADNDWYMLIIDSSSPAIIEAAAAWTEATYKIFQAQTSDTDVLTSSTTDVGSVLSGLSYFRTSLWFNQDLNGALAAGISGNRSTATPGSDTWALKSLSGVLASDSLTATNVSKLKLKNTNWYQSVGTDKNTFGGMVVGGEYIDVVRFLDWLRATMQVGVYNALKAYAKVPNTNEGYSIIQGAIETVLQQGEKVGGFKPGSTSSYVPDESDTSAFDAVTRTLSGVTFTGTMANAVHAVEITGSVTN